MLKACFAIGLSVIFFGCTTETASSSDIRTHGIAAQFNVRADDDASSKVKAVLRVGGDESNTYVILDNGDAIQAAAGGKNRTLQASSEGVYDTVFDTALADTEFKIMLQRPKDDDAVNNIGKLPAPFALGALPTSPVSRQNDSLTITWSPSGSGDSMGIVLDGNCIFADVIDVPGDPGTYTIAPGKIEPHDSNSSESCDVNVRVTRQRSGSVDTHLDSESTFSLEQRRSNSFVSAP